LAVDVLVVDLFKDAFRHRGLDSNSLLFDMLDYSFVYLLYLKDLLELPTVPDRE
jgi:hypothetical protein